MRPELGAAAESAAGVRAQFRSDASQLRLQIDRPGELVGRIDLLINGELVRRVEVHHGEQLVELSLPNGRNATELWLPQAETTRVCSLALNGASFVIPTQSAGTRWLAYGSSITQCFEAHGPSSTWPAIVARKLGWDLTCLGFSGQCFLDDQVATTLRDTAADAISICAGINIYERGEWGADELSKRLTYFVTTVLSGHNQTPVVLMSPIVSPSREDRLNEAALTLRDVRVVIKDVAHALESEGVRYVDGLEVLGHDDAEHLHDGLHPDGNGYLAMSERLTPLLSTLVLQ